MFFVELYKIDIRFFIPSFLHLETANVHGDMVNGNGMYCCWMLNRKYLN